MKLGFLIRLFQFILLFHPIFFQIVLQNCLMSVLCALCHTFLLLCIYSLPDNMNKWHVLHWPTFTTSALMLDTSRITVHWAEMLLYNFLFSAWQTHCKISLLSHPHHLSFSIKHKNPSKVPETSLEVTYWLFKSPFCTTWAYFLAPRWELNILIFH